MSMKFVTLTSAAALLLSAGVAPLAAAELKVSGAAAVAGNIVMPHKADIEKETGLTLNVTVNGDGNGLKDLSAGKVDVMMVAAPIKVTEAAVNKQEPGSASTAGVEVAPIGALKISFIVNAANPVKSLTAAQLKDIFTGKIKSWKDVGGPDKPIVIVAEPAGFGTRANIVSSLLEGAELSGNVREMRALVQVAQVVGQVPDAIGYGNAATISGGVAVIPGTQVDQQLGLATKGAPSADVKKLIAAAAKFGATVK